MSQVNPTCPNDCTSILAENTYNECAQTTAFGEVQRIFIASNAAAVFTDVTDLAEWLARLSEDSTSIDAIRRFRVIGDFPVATTDETIISLGQKIQSPADFVVNFEIEDVSDENYAFMRTLECDFFVKVWWEADGYIFGGNDGLDATVSMKYKVDRGQKTLHKIVGMIKWTNQFSPERDDSPFA